MKTVNLEKVKFPEWEGFTGDEEVINLARHLFIRGATKGSMWTATDYEFLDDILNSNGDVIYWSDQEDKYNEDGDFIVSYYPVNVVAAAMNKFVIEAEKQLRKGKNENA